jgi:hexokinase
MLNDLPHHTGGTNLRVCLVTLQGEGKFEVTQSKYRLTEEQKQGDGQALFDFCAECLKTFVDTNFEEGTLKPNELLPLGFTVCSPARTSRVACRLNERDSISSRIRARERV